MSAFGADTDPIAEGVRLLDKATAYWYACGYNDHRSYRETWVDPQAFAEYWLVESGKPSHRSLQATFGLFKDSTPTMTRPDRFYFTQINGTDHEVQENASDGSRFCYTCNTTVDGDSFHDPVTP